MKRKRMAAFGLAAAIAGTMSNPAALMAAENPAVTASDYVVYVDKTSQNSALIGVEDVLWKCYLRK